MFDFKKRIVALRRVMKNEGLDAFISVTIEDNNKNPYYLTGFSGTTGAVLVGRKNAVLAVDARYILRAEKEARGVQVVPISPYIRKSGDFGQYVETALTALNLPKSARRGYEGSRVSVLSARAWEKRLGRLIPTHGIVERLRQVKDTEEIERLRHAGSITSDVFVAVAQKVRAGMRESDIAAFLDIELRKRGALGASFKAIVASGENSAIPHHETGERKLKKGDPVVLDFGGVFPGGYCSDLTRTIFVPGKKPDTALVEIYRIVHAAHGKAFKALAPGMTWEEYDGVARSFITENGYGEFFTHGLGHSIGLEVHDPYDYAHDRFVEGTVLSNEPGIYLEGVGGVRIEDDVVVTKTGAKCLTPAPYLV